MKVPPVTLTQAFSGIVIATPSSLFSFSSPPTRDAVVGALMPACMMLPMECPSSSPVPPSDTSSSSGMSDDEGSPAPQESEERLSPSPWQERKGEVRERGPGVLDL